MTTSTSVPLTQLLYDLSNAIKTVDALQQNLKPGGGGFVDAGVADVDGQLRKLQQDFMKLYNDPTKNTYALMLPAVAAIYQKLIDIIASVKVIYDSLPTIVGPTISNALPTQTVEFKMRNDIATVTTQLKSLLASLITHHFEIAQKSAGTKILDGNNPNVKNALQLTGINSLANATRDAAVELLYRSLAIKIALMDQLSKIANAASVGPAATDARDAVLAAIPDFATLKASIDAQFTIAADPTPAKVVTNLTTNLAAAATDKDRVILIIAKTFADEENKVKTPAVLVPVPPGIPEAIVAAVIPMLTDAQQKVTAAAISGTLKADVVAALTYTPVEAKEYPMIASGVITGTGVSIAGYYKSLVTTAAAYEDVFDQSLLQSFGTYKTFVAKAGQSLMVLPPAAAIAGVYTSVDDNRGVWKAPANVSLASVLGPYLILNNKDQESLNIDPNAGKSINVIRAFTGQGTIVWGTRTLAGNDNEWKFIPVRRFFNYAEESIKKATNVFVFEPNDINTWVRVKAMIENFLTLEWRRGALAGAKPGDAFYVKIGLGETMTPNDILDGTMIVEIGMAVVRPAEFIILRFAHKMQES
ncbi:phage tail sheath family protein [Chitinophaga silvatica]|uniref:Phage tail sheath family protein n=2 Tax=Chitinophaga silvatica TaxID=2282649 RepID=A0A3E1Y3Z4_9BACT|nr:phage tail sheath family protein [Chitinophaga silvatica]